LGMFSTDGLCPACLIRTALEELPSEEAFSILHHTPLGPGARAFGRFELLDVLGRGGMGIVYRARDRASRRIVALKLATPHLLAHGDSRARFEAEIRAAASLDHPHVLPIHEVGEHDGIPFFTMRLAEGGSLATRLREFVGRPRDSAILLAKVARAVDHAHSRGVLHRDLKPANILLGDEGHPYVSDFGLMKWMTGDGAAVSSSSVVAGAPGYIAPEQVRRQSVGPAADVFSLGVVLYELLTGQKPFVGTTFWEAMERIESGSYAPPRSIAQQIPRDLETICRKCLESDPAQRYASAGALAEDLERFIDGRPILARPSGAWVKAWSWARRNPRVAVLGASVLALLVAGAAGSTIASVVLARARDRAVIAEAGAQENLWQSLLSEARALRSTLDIGHRHKALAALQRAASIRFAPELRDEAIQALTLTDLRVTTEWTSDLPFGCFSPDLSRYALKVGEGLCAVRSSTDHTTLATLAAPDGSVYDCWRFTPDGETLSIIGRQGKAWLWRWREGGVVAFPYPLDAAPVCLEFSPSGDLIAAPAEGGGVALYDLAGRLRATIGRGIARPWAFAFSPDGRTLAVSSRAGKDVALIDVSTKSIHTALPHGAAVSCLRFSPDGLWLAAGSVDANVALWHLPTREAGVLRGHSRLCTSLAFSPDGSVLVSGGYDQTARFWEVATRRPLLVMTATDPWFFFDPTGSRVGMCTEDGGWALFDFLPNTVRFTLTPASDARVESTVSLALDRGGKLAAIGGEAGVRFYDTATRREVAYIESQVRGRHDVQFDPATDGLWGTIGDKTLWRWSATLAIDGDRMPTYRAPARQAAPPGPMRLAGVGASSRMLALADIDAGVLKFAPIDGDRNAARELTHPLVRRAVFDPRGRWMLSGGWKSPRVSIWSIPELNLVHELPETDNADFAIGADGRLAVIGTPRAYRVFETTGWTETHAIARTEAPLIASYVAAARDAPLAACQWTPDSLLLIDLRTGQPLGTLPITLTTGLDQFAFTPNGSGLAVAGEHHAVQWWDLRELDRHLAAHGLGWRTALPRSTGSSSGEKRRPALSSH
ncbi:MAG: WD40 repeat domain-containing serine/threonine protein kinase, partial [Opitutaceae bacterium]